MTKWLGKMDALHSAVLVASGSKGTLTVARELVRCGHRALAIAAPGRLAQAIVEAGAEHVPWAGGGEVRALRGAARPGVSALTRAFCRRDMTKPGQAPALAVL